MVANQSEKEDVERMWIYNFLLICTAQHDFTYGVLYALNISRCKNIWVCLVSCITFIKHLCLIVFCNFFHSIYEYYLHINFATQSLESSQFIGVYVSKVPKTIIKTRFKKGKLMNIYWNTRRGHNASVIINAKSLLFV